VDKVFGQVKTGGQILANTSGEEEAIRDGIIAALNVISSSSELKKVIETYWTLTDSCNSARQTAKRIKMLGMVPGLCDICQRLGLR